jgi:tetratricopeptide (TPR) repeat protein
MIRFSDYDEYMETAKALLGSYDNVTDLWEANDCVNAALRIRPQAPSTWLLKSQILSAVEDDYAALAAAEMATRIAPESAEAHFVRATVLADLERYDEALQSIRQAFSSLTRSDSDTLMEDLYFEKAAVLEALDRVADAEATFESGLCRCPESVLLKSGLEPLRRQRVASSLKVIQGGG